MSGWFARYAGIVFDIDGVLVRGHSAVPGAADALTRLRAHGTPLLFASNNATRTADDVVGLLAGAGITAEPSEVLSSTTTAAGLLEPGTRCVVIGTEALRGPVRARGCVLVEDPLEAEAVVVGMDFAICYPQLADAALAIGAGARFIGTNPDRSFPTERGLLPGNGALLALLSATTGVEPEIAGKPARAMFDAAAALLPAGPLLMVGDRVDTDVHGAAQAGWDTALVLTGVTGAAQAAAADPPPTRILDDLSGLFED